MKSFKFSSLLILSFIFILFTLFNCSSYIKKYNNALDLQQQGNLGEAEKVYLEIIDSKPDDAELNNNLGSLYLSQGEYEKARTFLEKAAAIKPLNAGFHFNLGILYQEMGMPDNAISEFEECLKYDMNNFKAAFNIANIYYEKGDLNNAERFYMKCKNLNPEFEGSYFNLGLVYEKKADIDNASFYYQKYAALVKDENRKFAVTRILSELMDREIAGETKGITTEKVDVDDVPVIKKNLDKKSNTLVVVIGIEYYRHHGAATYKTNDAEKFREYMINMVGVPERNIYYRVNDAATKAELDYIFFNERGWLKRRIKKGETDLIIFLAGHGYHDLESKQPFFIPQDVRAEQATNGISLRLLYASLAQMGAKNVIIFVESCFSGVSFDNQPLAVNVNPVRMEIEYPEISMKNFIVITAASAQQYSSNSDKLQHGIFTYYLLKGIKGSADTNADEVLTIGELWNYIKTGIPEEAINLDRDQTPVISPAGVLENKKLMDLQILTYEKQPY